MQPHKHDPALPAPTPDIASLHVDSPLGKTRDPPADRLPRLRII